MKYFENKTFTSSLRKEYLDSIIEFSNMSFPNIKSEDAYVNELGYPLTLNKHEDISFKRILLSKEDGFNICRYTFTILDVIKMSGLLFEVDETSPLVLMQHGYVGTPEVMSNIYEDRNTYNYNDIVKRLLSLKVNVFCPQLLMWSIEQYGVEYDRVMIDKKLREKGSSIISLETYCLKEIVHFFKQKSYKYINMFGMSYGAYYTYHVGYVSDELKTLWGCSFLTTNTNFEEMKFNTPLCDVIRKVFINKDLYITVGDHDPIMVYDKVYKFLDSLPNKEKIVVFDGDHEVYKSDEFLKLII